MLELLRRHGLTLLLVAAMVLLYFTQARPAFAKRERLREERARQEQLLEQDRAELRRLELWRDHMDDDELLRERALDELRRSPERTGPVILPAPDEPPALDDELSPDGAR